MKIVEKVDFEDYNLKRKLKLRVENFTVFERNNRNI